MHDERSSALNEELPESRASGRAAIPDQPIEETRTPAGEPLPDETELSDREHIDTGGRSLREHAVRGVVINSMFQVGLAGLGLFRRFTVAAFLTASEFGIWGLMLTTLITLGWLKQVGISDKFIQQTESDQELAFHHAFTFELLYSGLYTLVLLIVLPIYAIAVFGEPQIILPGCILTLAFLFSAFQTPIWIAYRGMRFVRQRVLEAVDPVIATVVTIALAIAGLSYWSLVIGAVAGSLIGAIVAVATSPYPLALRFDRGVLRQYFSFSWPLFLLSASALVVVQGSVIVGNLAVGLAGVGAIGLAGSFATFADRVDSIITRTIYPAVCAVQGKTELLREVLVKTNRVGLMWGMPFGIGLGLFGGDLVNLVLGERWSEAAPLLQVFGVTIAFRQVAFNWSAFMRARGETRPMAVNGGLAVVVFAVATAPLMFIVGLGGYAIGMAVAMVVDLMVRAHYLARMFPGFSLLRHLLRALAPIVPAVAAVLALRLLLPDLERTPLLVGGEVVLFALTSVLLTVWFERSLVREVWRYARGKRSVRRVSSSQSVS